MRRVGTGTAARDSSAPRSRGRQMVPRDDDPRSRASDLPVSLSLPPSPRVQFRQTQDQNQRARAGQDRSRGMCSGAPHGRRPAPDKSGAGMCACRVFRS